MEARYTGIGISRTRPQWVALRPAPAILREYSGDERGREVGHAHSIKEAAEQGLQYTVACGGSGEKGRDQGEDVSAKQVPYAGTGKEIGNMVNSKRAQIGKLRIQPRGSTCGQAPDLQNWQERIRQVASKDKEVRFTTLWHHVYNVGNLREAYFSLKRQAAPGVDGKTWKQYGEMLEENIQELSDKLRRGAYRAKAVKRVYIPKADGNERPIGIPALEDKIVQRTMVEVLNCIYETDFKGFSYGFRPRRSQHDALDAVAVGINTRYVSWVLDADICGFFDAIDHKWLMKFVEHRIADKRMLRHIKKWLNAGVLEDGVRKWKAEGTPQGGSISPLLANIYLHYAFDLWADHWRKTHASGEVIMVRYADDIVVGFQYRADGRRFKEAMRERLQKFELELHTEKTRLLEFGRFATENAKRRGEGKPKTFDFLGFRHICDRTTKGHFTVLRETIPERMQRKLKEVKRELRKRMHLPIPEVGRWLKSVLRGHYRYYGVPRNSRRLSAFRYYVSRLWMQSLQRRSQRYKNMREQMRRLANQWLPNPAIYHPYPEERLGVIYPR